MKSVLFVDDEPRILDGLRRMLHGQRRVWDMGFATSGDEALRAMATQPFDVVVSDMRMPAMDGAVLLGEVQRLYPRTVRIVLSGHADLEASMRSVRVSHQYLTKPCDADFLKEVVERACGLESVLGDRVLRETIGEVGELPMLPRTYSELTKALAEPEVDLVRVAEIVEQDSAIAAKVLHLVNSSFFGVRKEISNLRQATSFLGVNTIRDLVLSFEVFREFGGKSPLKGFSVQQEQGHSLLCARISKRLLQDKKAAEQAFIAGMLHDLGKLVLATRLPERIERVTDAGGGSERSSHLVEEEVFGVSHAEIGAYLLGLWGMPYPIVEAVANHHHPSRVTEQTTFGVLGAVHVADVLAREQHASSSPAALLEEPYLTRMGVADQLPGWREIAAEEAGHNEQTA